MAGCATAQSYQQKTVDGKKYYVHHVAPGNTLFAIAKSFSVEVADLVAANPGADQGLSIGQEILVPVDAIDQKAARKSDIRTEGEFVLHTVQKKETLFSLSKQYGVSVNELSELNPEAARQLTTGAVLRIPVAKSTTIDQVYLAPASSDTFMVHQVVSGETPYSISKKYDIPLDSINKANDGFVSGIRIGQWIKIPKYKEAFLEANEALFEPVDSSMAMYATENLNKYNIAFLLPFELHLNDSLVKSLMAGKELFVLTEIALEYYRGARIAIDSLEKMGLNAEIYVFDVGEDVVDAREIMRRPEMRKMHMIFGPMHKGSLGVVSDESKKAGTYLVSPNTFTNEVFADNPYLFRAAASRETMLRYLANFTAIQHTSENVLMVNSEKPNDWPYRKLFKGYYNEAMGTYPNTFSDSIRSVTKEQFLGEKAAKWLRKDVKNILIVPSNELAFVSDFLTRISSLDSEYEIQVYGLDQWIRYDNIEAAYKNRFKLRLVVPGFVNYEEPHVIEYLSEFRERYHMEPSRWGYGFLGYDLTMYFGKALLEHGLGFPRTAGDEDMIGTYTNYRFGKSSTGQDFENKSVYILEYDAYDLKRIN
jgi:LysM repeat protein